MLAVVPDEAGPGDTRSYRRRKWAARYWIARGALWDLGQLVATLGPFKWVIAAYLAVVLALRVAGLDGLA